jgi:hypothetical protein
MNIIQQQREDIINNNNAQQDFTDIIDTYTKRISSIDIHKPLSGDLDLSQIREQFNLLENIYFEEGEITNVKNIPEGIKSLSCSKNLLISIDDLPSSLEELNISYNYFHSIDLKNLPNLLKLNLSHNKFHRIENLPKSLKELNIEYNQLTDLNLEGLSNLKSLNVSNNNITIISNLPENLTEFDYDNNPSIEFRNSNTTLLDNKKDDEDNDIRQQINYEEALHEYFSLKNKYENILHNEKKNIYKNSQSKKLAKQRIMSYKSKCINCNRPVGTIFSHKDYRYIAICGDAEKPCNLNIEIYSGNHTPRNFMLEIMTEGVNEMKDNIISLKLDTLFNYITEKKSIELYKKMMDDYNLESNIVNNILNEYNEFSNNNPHKLELIKKKRDTIFKYIENNRELLNEYDATENKELLKSAVQLQVDDLLPETKNLRLLTHEHMEMTEKSKAVGGFSKDIEIMYYLFKNEIALSKIDYAIGEPPRVMHFTTNK